MRPDYTLSFWPYEIKYSEAEAQDSMVHIHFDAKYRVNSLEEIIGKPDEELLNENETKRDGTYKRSDLLKMHAYKDAIKRTEGAYILYPGNQDKKWSEYNGVLPGVGAFAITPGYEGEAIGLGTMSNFLDDVVKYLCDRFSEKTSVR
jgi:predicted component of viral defense system (DUF524 family)